MAMDKITGSPLLRQHMLDKFQDTSQTRHKADETRTSGTAGSHQAPAEKAEISPAALRLVELRQMLESGRAALEDIPDIRDERVAEVRTRLDRGFYNSVEVQEEVASRLGSVLQAFGEV